MTVRALAEAIGRPPSSYATYENGYKKPFLPMDLVMDLAPVLTARGVARDELYALGGAPTVSEKPTAPIVPAMLSYDPEELRKVVEAIFIIADPAEGPRAFADAVIEAYERIMAGKIARGRP